MHLYFIAWFPEGFRATFPPISLRSSLFCTNWMDLLDTPQNLTGNGWLKMLCQALSYSWLSFSILISYNSWWSSGRASVIYGKIYGIESRWQSYLPYQIFFGADSPFKINFCVSFKAYWQQWTLKPETFLPLCSQECPPREVKFMQWFLFLPLTGPWSDISQWHDFMVLFYWYLCLQGLFLHASLSWKHNLKPKVTGFL